MITFGPIPSRRLGKSLGINNIVPGKICSYNCVYCQVGMTRQKTITRREYYSPENIAEAVAVHLNKLKSEHFPDYLTFVPNGEPTLDINLGREIKLLKQFGIPLAVITNSSNLHDENVRAELMEADWVSVKADATDVNTWQKINRPDDRINFKAMHDGIRSFASVYKGELHTETMLIEGYNASTSQLEGCASFICELGPRKAYIAVPTRPTAEKGTKPVPAWKLTRAWQIFQHAGLNSELLAGFEGTGTGVTGNPIDDILNITAVHPLREDALTRLLEQDRADQSITDSLIKQRLIKSVLYNGKRFYVRNYMG